MIIEGEKMEFFKNIFGRKDTLHKETFTYFVAAPPERNNGYREKELDSLTLLFAKNNVHFEIVKTVSHDKGFWCIFKLEASLNNFNSLNDQLEELSLRYNPSRTIEGEDLEIIQEGDEGFKDHGNFQV